MACTFKKKTTNPVCYADLKTKVAVVERFMQPNHPDAPQGQYNQISERFLFYAMAMTSNRGVANSSGVNINGATTHQFYARYRDVQSFVFDVKRHKLLVKNKYYKIEHINNVNEDNITVAFYCNESGDKDNWGSHS